ncbi:hypothetical protein D3C80_1859710 [compost metagenome]
MKVPALAEAGIEMTVREQSRQAVMRGSRCIDDGRTDHDVSRRQQCDTFPDGFARGWKLQCLQARMGKGLIQLTG